MKPQKIKKLKIQELNEVLELAQKIDKKIKDFDVSSAKIAEKWQTKVEDISKKTNE